MVAEKSFRILLLETSGDSAASLREVLSAEYAIDRFTAEAAVHDYLTSRLPELIIFHVLIPNDRLTEICAQFRHELRTRDIPIMVVSEDEDPEHRVALFHAGADDYVYAPYSSEEINARVCSKLRRVEERNFTKRWLSCAGIEIEPQFLRVRVQGRELALSALEFRLLQYFLKHQGEVLSRQQILEEVWQGTVVSERTVDAHIASLRKKIGSPGLAIRTIYGAGYVLALEQREPAVST